ncbi:MAG TPA: chemotaxis protein CheW [Clostridia bacterium]|nr:chemotaxis protein CheW [Clostridia bacterium]
MQNTQGLDFSNRIEDSDAGRYLTFFTDGQMFGISTSAVVQIVGLQDIIRMPDAPAYVKGVINLRGDVFPVIDMRLRLGHPEAPYNERTCIIVTQISGSAFGFIVDAVDEVRDISDAQISPPPKICCVPVNDYLTGIGRLEAVQGKQERMVLLIDAAHLLKKSELSALSLAVTAQSC